MRHGALLTGVLLVAGCGAGMWASVPVKGSDASLASLAGKWEGTFEGAGASSKGVIHFDLAKGSRYAEGQVTFNAAGGAAPTTVPIRQVNANDQGQIAGVIGPYAEPQTKAQVQTAFVGTLQGATISGTFTTRIVGSSEAGQRGQWQMTKKP